MTTKDLSAIQDKGGWAKYLPAISGFYTTHFGYLKNVPNYVPENRNPAGFEYGMEGMDFLKPTESYYHYKYGLYSAGHAERKLDKCDKRAPTIHGRHKDTVLVGDSGGFQIATGVIKLDWANVKGEAGDKLREEILRWLEYTAEWSMTLDVPAFAATAPLNLKTGLTKFQDALDITEINLHYFMKNRVPGATKFLNVLSGSNEATSKTWFDTVIHFSDPESVKAMGYTKDRTLEGYAFAGANMRKMYSTLSRILDLRDMNLLHDKDWIHFLGVGRMDWACFLTSIERQLKKHDNPNITLSFDAASPFVAAGGYALAYDYNHYSANRLTYSMGKGLDDKNLKGTSFAMPYGGPIMDRLTTGDICFMGPNDPNKHGKISKTSWDTTTYAMFMAHNVYNHITAVQEINKLADLDYATRETRLYMSDWYAMRNAKKAPAPLNDFVPQEILFFNQFAIDLLDPANPDPRKMLEDNKQFLEHISFGNLKVDTSETHNIFFGEIEGSKCGAVPSGEEMADMRDVGEIEIDLDD
jgi:hypothetical protein